MRMCRIGLWFNYKCVFKKRGVASNSTFKLEREINVSLCFYFATTALSRRHSLHLKFSLSPVREEFHTHTLPHTPQVLDMFDL